MYDNPPNVKSPANAPVRVPDPLAGLALLPRSLRLCLRDQELPGWFTRKLWLAGRVTYADLDESVWDRMLDVPEKVGEAVIELMTPTMGQIDAPIHHEQGNGHLYALDPSTIEALSQAGLPAERSALARLSWNELSDQIGVEAALDVGRAVEMPAVIAGPYPTPQNISSPLLVATGNIPGAILRFGEPGCDLLPSDLRRFFNGRRLPRIARQAVGGLIDTYDQLDDRVWDLTRVTPQGAGKAAIAAVNAVLTELPNQPVLAGWPEGLSVAALPWRQRSVSTLNRLGAWNDPQRLRSFTYVELAAVPSAGAMTILDISVIGNSVIPLATTKVVSDPDNLGARPPHAGFGGTVARPWLEALSEAEVVCAPLESALWFRAIHDDDPRFGDTARTARAVLNQNAGSFSEKALRRLPDLVQLMTTAADQDQPEPLEAALSAVLTAPMAYLNGSRLDAILQRLGWTGRDPLTLEGAAQLVGLTRERIRQITSQADKRRSQHPPLLPALDIVLELLEDSLPVNEDDFQAQQRDRGLSIAGLTIEGLRKAADWTHRVFPEVDIVGYAHTRRVIAAGALNLEKAILAEARRQNSAWGAASVSEILTRLADETHEPSRDDVLTILKAVGGLTADDEWWHVATARNRMQNEVRKMLAACGPLTPGQLRAGLVRHYPVRQIDNVPPESAVEFMCRQVSWIRIEDGRAALDPPQDYREVLGEVEATMVEILRGAPDGVLDRQEFMRACMDRGLSDGSVSVYTTFSPILERPTLNVWTLRGSVVNPVAVERIREKSRNRPDLPISVRWDERGRLVIARQLGFAALSSKVLGIPASAKPYLAGRAFAAVTTDATPTGTVQVAEDSNSWGWGPFLRQAMADENSVLLASFDLGAGTVELQLGTNDDLLDL